MQIKKFVADNAQEAIKKVRDELGDDAVIIHTKKIKVKGIFGISSKEKVEVLAALEKQSIDNKNSASEHSDTELLNKSAEETNKSKKEYTNKIRKEYTIDTYNREKDVSEINNQIQELKTMMMKINNKVDINLNNDANKDSLKKVYDLLESVGLSKDLIEDILSNIGDKHFDDDDFIKYIKSYFIEKFKKQDNETVDLDCKINIFVGTTGVGKTTTLAKLASKQVLKKDKKVGFLTLDTYRISAVDQLKTYADILNAPLEVAYDLDDVSYSIQRLKNKDIIFIDTAGRSHKNKEHMEELKQFINCFEQKNIFLVLNANWHIQDIKEIIKNYSFLDNYKIIITKIDETSRTGVIFDILYHFGNKIKYIAYGQNVPDDIEEFDIEKIVDDIWGGRDCGSSL
ncbi:flagellar biosynthesis protein FlhF [Tepidibacter hydrothermalis]|uniref:Flagellar biosynthesis protein FlhF n=1 Tax=Tepidibacter hydrothermalis TaxID=3036126 RepID=A0ABY8EFG4_9FIRM|nr:flagellar biosynthesis protein FlhF [Tepidibacter hydrothermalis]WFD11694.1 flagellar biosynthesis protein FlhF [Tepidibacter hydrothermalis]